MTTVSHVLNEVKGARVSPETRVKVLAAARELDYQPNRLARSLRVQRSDSIAMVGDWLGASPFGGEVTLGALEAAGRRGTLLYLMNTNADPELESREVRALLDRQVDGLIFSAEYHKNISSPNVPSGSRASSSP